MTKLNRQIFPYEMGRYLAFVALVIFALQSSSPATAQQGAPPSQIKAPISHERPDDPEQRARQKSPLVVSLLNSGKGPEETAQDWWVIYLTGALALGTFLVFAVGVYQARITRHAIRDQASANERTIAEAAKSAASMASVAQSMSDNVARLRETVEIAKDNAATNKSIADRQKAISEMQLRAYLSVVIGDAVYQERDKGLRFEGKAILLSQGPTPATRVIHRTEAAILPVPLPSDFVMPPFSSDAAGENMIGPQQNRILGAVVKEFCDDGDVVAIKRAEGRGLYIWGIVTYEDVFKVGHTVEFCHLLTWRGDKVWGYFSPNRNRAD